jgi:ribosomal protein S18 acetylase RimI-like enzyme
MSEIIISNFKDTDRSQVEAIFFESSTKKDFKDEKEKKHFRYKYLDYYLEKFPTLAFVAKSGEQVLGYVVGSTESNNELQPHMTIFSDYLNHFPAHLHINCHHEARGQGVGSKLIIELEKKLQISKIQGLHIMTGPDSLNQNFYKKLGFDFTIILPFKDRPILMMGKRFK